MRLGCIDTKPAKPPNSPLPPSHEAVPKPCQDSTASESASIGNSYTSIPPAYVPVGAAPQDGCPEEDLNVHPRKRLKTTPAAIEASAVQTDFLLTTSIHGTAAGHDNASPAKADELTSLLSPPRKVLKLNANGKLLSSPPPQRIEEKVNIEAKSKQKGDLNKRKTKIVVIECQNKTISKKVDDILFGRQRYNPTTKPAPTTNPPPPKATHPFFLKKSVSQVPQEPLAAPVKAEVKQDYLLPRAQQQPPRQSQFSRSLFPKAPEPIAPVWPPKDLVHVRGVEYQPSNASPITVRDRRKNKEPILQIHDSENILLNELHLTWKEIEDSSTDSEKSSLRVPKRSVASGVTLQKALNTQLSQGASQPKHGSGYCGEEGRSHPSIAKLYKSVATSMTAFDTGQYDSFQWAYKYAPTCAEEVLQPGPEAHLLRDWLRNLTISSVDTGKPGSGKKKAKQSVSRKTKRRKASDKLDGFIVSSEDEASEMSELLDSDDDELAGNVTVSSKRTVVRVGDSVGKFKKGDSGRMTNALLISGPNGCGKSASVYAVAKELDFEVFEINSGNRRSAKDIVERVGDMTHNHLIRLEGDKEKGESSDGIHQTQFAPVDANQNKLNTFFKVAPAIKLNSRHDQARNEKAGQITQKPPKTQKQMDTDSSRHQKQSLILLEEVDVLFEEDKQFWVGVLALISQSKRPVIMTCNNEELIPLQNLSLHAILRYQKPHPDIATDYLLVLAASEGHMLERKAVNDLYLSSNQDLRKSIMEVNFWCQMAVGSEKSGIDWILDRWPLGKDVDIHGDKLKVISLQTYPRFIGWFNRNVTMTKNSLARESELLLEGMNWWQLEIDMEGVRPHYSSVPATQDSCDTRIEELQIATILADSCSSLDMLAHSWSLDANEDELDPTIPDLSEKQKSNYQEGFPLLNASRKPDYTGLSASIGSTAQILIRHLISRDSSLHHEVLTSTRVLSRQTRSKSPRFSSASFSAFEPIMPTNYSVSASHGPLFSGNDVAVIAQDLAPYIRSIMDFDLRLERYRFELSGLRSQSSKNKKVRTTRASRAALEGGSKSNTRRERWFSAEANPKRIMATGSKGWQDALVQAGHFSIQPLALEGINSGHSDSEDGSQV
ncbi:hypothetical protein BGW36DRAFT_353700 [Talaromyces proteolyticus]|uniref:AAA+ ATPase domain-containing protein n=1 Tax=Talaromyces proteolyticus TaxID=1131652 RepID=A0AAD4L3K2_9EURO|nr:uncharacterized protein BGW36DRAFT_353700 [Talaromyces proteolyticus]KAH8705292.1 hypothetical protein BGW36DRAFT_353700 [Talaromyces proteolyticus]